MVLLFKMESIYKIIKCTTNIKRNIIYNSKYGICDFSANEYSRLEIYYEVPLKAINALNDMNFNNLNIDGINLTSLDWMLNHPNFNKIETIRCPNNKLIKLPLWPNVKFVFCQNNNIEKLPLWPNVCLITCDISKLKYIPYWPKIETINYVVIEEGYKIRGLLFWHLVKINKENRKIKMSIRIHELKWRNINAEIVCRPNTGIEWHNYRKTINEL